MGRHLLLLVALSAAFVAGRSSTRVDWQLPLPPIVVTLPPVPGDGLHLMVIEETWERPGLPRGQQDVIRALRAGQLADGFAVRVWDKDMTADDIAADPEREWFTAAMALERQSLPWIVVSNGKTGFSGPVPDGVEAMADLLRRYKP